MTKSRKSNVDNPTQSRIRSFTSPVKLLSQMKISRNQKKQDRALPINSTKLIEVSKPQRKMQDESQSSYSESESEISESDFTSESSISIKNSPTKTTYIQPSSLPARPTLKSVPIMSSQRVIESQPSTPKQKISDSESSYTDSESEESIELKNIQVKTAPNNIMNRPNVQPNISAQPDQLIPIKLPGIQDAKGVKLMSLKKQEYDSESEESEYESTSEIVDISDLSDIAEPPKTVTFHKQAKYVILYTFKFSVSFVGGNEEMSDILEDIFTDSSNGKNKRHGKELNHESNGVETIGHNDELNLDEFEEALKGI